MLPQSRSGGDGGGGEEELQQRRSRNNVPRVNSIMTSWIRVGSSRQRQREQRQNQGGEYRPPRRRFFDIIMKRGGSVQGPSSSSNNLPTTTNKNTMLFTDLPDEILLKLFGDGYLTAQDVVHCSKLNRTMKHWFFGRPPSSSPTISASTCNKNDDHGEISIANDDENIVNGNFIYDFNHIELAKHELWMELLLQEGLPGSTIQDLVLHHERWDRYRHELKQILFQVSSSPIGGGSSDTNRNLDSWSGLAVNEGMVGAQLKLPKPPSPSSRLRSSNNYKKSCLLLQHHQKKKLQERCHEFLCRAIAGYTQRVCNAYSWYKHLPISSNSAYFEFTCDLTSNLRYDVINGIGQWNEYIDNDNNNELSELSLHHNTTWIATRKYRRAYGNFTYSCRYEDQNVAKNIKDNNTTRNRNDERSNCNCNNTNTSDGTVMHHTVPSNTETLTLPPRASKVIPRTVKTLIHPGNSKQQPPTNGLCAMAVPETQSLSGEDVEDSEKDGDTVCYLPYSSRVDPVSVSAVLHDRSYGDLYYSALLAAITNRDPTCLTRDPIHRDWAERDVHFVENGALPVEAALDLQAMALAYLGLQGLQGRNDQQRLVAPFYSGSCSEFAAAGSTRAQRLQLVMKRRFIDPFPSQPTSTAASTSSVITTLCSTPYTVVSRNYNSRAYASSTMMMPSEHDLWGWANLAVQSQKYRERMAIGHALYDVCLKTYGKAWVPAWSNVQQAMLNWNLSSWMYEEGKY